MLLWKVKAEGLAHLSYLIGSEGRAAVIDPRRDCQVYLDLAREHELAILFILETHRNEDYVTGSRELQALTGAKVLHGDLDFGYGERVRDGEEISLGKLTLRAMETPGHTPESMCYAVVDHDAGPEVVAVFTGDTLFVGDVGRTDLFGLQRIDELSALQYESLFGGVLPLGDRTIIFPAHGAGSPCGGDIGTREDSTIGLERAQNHALKVGGKEEFVALKRREAFEKPPYFERMEEINLKGQPVLGHLPRAPPVPPAEAGEKGGVMLDIRSPPAFAGSHIPGSLSIPLEILSHYGGWVLPYGRSIMLVVEDAGSLDEAVRALVRIGHDDIVGHVRDGMDGWYKAGLPTARFDAITARELHERAGREDLTFLDIRMEKEWKEGHVENALHIFVGYLEARIEEVPPDRPVAVLCSSGQRGSLAASILEAHGRTPINLLGGMGGWRKAGLPVVR